MDANGMVWRGPSTVDPRNLRSCTVFTKGSMLAMIVVVYIMITTGSDMAMKTNTLATIPFKFRTHSPTGTSQTFHVSRSLFQVVVSHLSHKESENNLMNIASYEAESYLSQVDLQIGRLV